jgi:multiple sugar transport system ATP-binding protein
VARVELAGVEKVYPGGTHAVRALSLRVADGELLVLVGPSGCGKSTVLRLVAGLEPVTAGHIAIDDRIVNDLSPQARNVAMVFQDYALYPHMTVRENLAFPLRMRRLPAAERERRVTWAAGLLGLAALLDRLPRQLSGGQRQRVAMGRALVREPAAFLLDEPLSNLDAKLRGEVRAEIEDLQRRTGTTMLYVTHDQVEAMTLGDRVAVLSDGRLEQVAPPRELYERPASPFVAGFVGSPPMNLLPGRLGRDPAGRAVVWIGPLAIALSERAAAAAPPAGGAVTVGVRPESLAVAAPDARDVLPARVAAVELLGHETLVHLRAPDGAGDELRLVLRATGMRALERDEALSVRVDGAALHLFDAAGRRLD